MIAYRYQNLRDVMVGSWCPSLGSPSGLLLDRIGTNDGTLTNMDPGTDWVPSAGGGRGGYALDFDGSNDYVRIPHSVPLNFLNEYSLSGWINPNSPSVSYAALVSKPTSFVGNPYNMYGLQAWAAVGTPPRMVLGNSGAEYTLGATTTLSSGQWWHIGCCFRAGYAEIYVNGRRENSTTFGFTTIEQNTQPLGIGGVDRAGVADTAKALIDSVSIFSLALTPSDFRTLARYRGIEHEVYRVPIVRGATVSGAFSLTADAGTFTLSGQNANTLANRVVTGEAGSFVLTGQNAGLLAGRKVTGEAAAFALSGQDAGTRATRTTQGEAGAFTFTGQSAGLIAARKVAGEAGTFTLAGQDATLTYSPVGGFSLSAETAAFSFAGQSANLRATRLLSGDTASFVLTGQEANLTQSAAGVEVDANAFAITDLTTTWAW